MFKKPPFTYSITFNGIEITGIVLWCKMNDVEVEITSPYTGIRTGLHTTLWVNSPTIKNQNEDNSISEKGYSTISSCIITAYEESDFLFRNKDVLHDRILECKNELGNSIYELKHLNDNFPSEKIKMKNLYQEKQITQTEYRKFLKSYASKIEILEKRISEIYDNIFSGFEVNRYRFGVEKQYIQFIEKYF